MMNIVVPYVNGRLHGLVKPVLRSYGFSPQYFELTLDGFGDKAYSMLLNQLWKVGKTFIVVEQDILPWPGALEELAACPCEWGTYSYDYQGGVGISHMLGCAKITDKLIRRLPGLWEEPRPWFELDTHLFHTAREAGQEPHLHRPPVIHLKGM